MQIKRDYTAKYLQPMPNRKPVGIVLHDTAGSGTLNDVKYLANPSDGRQVSVDFCVTRDGSIWQLNPDLKKFGCWHAGRATKFKGLRNRDVSLRTIGIEIVQKANMSLVPFYTDEQVRAVAELCRDLCRRFGLGREDITTHAKIIIDGSRSDPRKFPFDAFWGVFGEEDGSSVAPEVFHTVQAGETLWAIANRYRTRVETVKALNGMNTASNLIEVGQVLKIK